MRGLVTPENPVFVHFFSNGGLTMTIRADGTSRLYSTTYFASARAGAFIQKAMNHLAPEGPDPESPRRPSRGSNARPSDP
jgi:hypothetical protein